MTGGFMAIELKVEAARSDSFDLVFNAHHDYVYNLAHLLLRNLQDAEDVTQEVFLRVYKALPTYEPERATMRTWLTRVTVNACQTHRRRNFLRNMLHQNPATCAGPTRKARTSSHQHRSEVRQCS